MTPLPLSISALVHWTGLPVDASWRRARHGAATLWHAPGTTPGECAADTLPALPPERAILVQDAPGGCGFDAEWPLALDVEWLREPVPGFPLGMRAARATAGVTFSARVELLGGLRTIMWTCEERRSHAALVADPRTPPLVRLSTKGVRSEGPDDVLRALTGTTPVEWLRGVLAESCSRRWSELAVRLGAPFYRLDELALCFHAMSTTEEHALWEAAGSAESLEELGCWAEALAECAGLPETLDAMLLNELTYAGTEFWRTAAGRWLSALSGVPRADLFDAAGRPKLAGAGDRARALLRREELMQLLVQLRAECDCEWNALSPWYRRRLEQSRAAASSESQAAQGRAQFSSWMTRLAERLRQAAPEAAREKLQMALAGLLAPGRFDGRIVECSGVQGEEVDAALRRVLAGDWNAALDSASGLRMHAGPLAYALGGAISVEMLLPFLDGRNWQEQREALATAEIRRVSPGQFSAAMAGTTELQGVVSRILCRCFTVRRERLCDDLTEWAFECRRAASDGVADSLWRRLLAAYGIAAQPAADSAQRLTLQSPSSWSQAWGQPWGARDGYYGRFAAVAGPLQEMLRHWLPALALSDSASFRNPSRALPMLVYAASKPCSLRRSGTLAWNTTNTMAVHAAAETAVQQLHAILAPICRSLVQSGESKLAEYYDPRRSRLIVNAVQRRPRNFASVLAADAALIEYCARIEAATRELRTAARLNPKRELRLMTALTRELAHFWERRTRRLPEACAELGPLFLLEATRLLAGGKLQSGLRVSLSVETVSNGRQWQAAA